MRKMQWQPGWKLWICLNCGSVSIHDLFVPCATCEPTEFRRQIQSAGATWDTMALDDEEAQG